MNKVVNYVSEVVCKYSAVLSTCLLLNDLHKICFGKIVFKDGSKKSCSELRGKIGKVLYPLSLTLSTIAWFTNASPRLERSVQNLTHIKSEKTFRIVQVCIIALCSAPLIEAILFAKTEGSEKEKMIQVSERYQSTIGKIGIFSFVTTLFLEFIHHRESISKWYWSKF